MLNHVPKQHCIIYLDNLLVHASDFKGALCHLQEVFAAIRQARLRLNLKKCQLFRRETAFLGHMVSDGGVATDPAKITAGRPPPTYVRNFATIARPLHRLTDRGQPYVWDDPCAQAFNALQTALIMAPVLAYPDANRPFVLDTEASNVGVGAVLSQPSDSGEQEARAQLAPMVATLRTIYGEAGCLPLSPAQVQEAQERDAALTHVQSWLAAGKRPEWADVAALDTETRAYHSQWASLEVRGGVLYRWWRAPDQGADLLQLLMPRALQTQVLQLVHGATGSPGHSGERSGAEQDGAFSLPPALWDRAHRQGDWRFRVCPTRLDMKPSNTGLYSARLGTPLVWTEESNCTVLNSTITSEINCTYSCGSDCWKSARYPCLQVYVSLNTSGKVVRLSHNEETHVMNPECFYVPKCRKDSAAMHTMVMNISERLKMHQRVPCYHEPGERQDSALLMRLYGRSAVFHSLFWPTCMLIGGTLIIAMVKLTQYLSILCEQIGKIKR
ncbi:hypothetical protein AAFF_G00003580 [Aldrovandia affinis]|uniref:ribonuclease H n=1 Tax=Aldrovandia affinis TaxID=143900 RepID=A0AAD7X4X9_9TELE|nr:hypothetical protein AAFF_G00003580 [Aldrovandia affinis]